MLKPPDGFPAPDTAWLYHYSYVYGHKKGWM